MDKSTVDYENEEIEKYCTIHERELRECYEGPTGDKHYVVYCPYAHPQYTVARPTDDELEIIGIGNSKQFAKEAANTEVKQ